MERHCPDCDDEQTFDYLYQESTALECTDCDYRWNISRPDLLTF